MDTVEAVADLILRREVREEGDALDPICSPLFYRRLQADLLTAMKIVWLYQGQQSLAPIVGIRGGDASFYAVDPDLNRFGAQRVVDYETEVAPANGGGIPSERATRVSTNDGPLPILAGGIVTETIELRIAGIDPNRR